MKERSKQEEEKEDKKINKLMGGSRSTNRSTDPFAFGLKELKEIEQLVRF